MVVVHTQKDSHARIVKNVISIGDTMNFPNECCRCGFCCLAETCPIGQTVYKIDQTMPCPGLSFDSQGKATCELAIRGLVPVGDGCCIKARAFKDGVQYDFASLCKETKHAVVESMRHP